MSDLIDRQAAIDAIQKLNIYKTEKRNCEICEHYKPDDRGKYSCEKWECEFKEMRELSERSEPKEKQQA